MKKKKMKTRFSAQKTMNSFGQTNNSNNNNTRKLAKQWQKSEETRYFGILMERLEDKFDLTMEAFAMSNERMTIEFNAVHTRLNEIDLILTEHTKILAEHTKILAEHTKLLAEIQRDIEIMKYDIAILKTDTKKKVDIDEFGKLERRVILLEKKR